MNITTCLFTVLGGMATLGHPSETVRLNQLGYYPQQEKVAVVNAGEVREFTIVDAATGNRVFSGKPGYIASSAWSDKSRTILDFSDITAPGNYFLMVKGDSVALEIKERVLHIDNKDYVEEDECKCGCEKHEHSEEKETVTSK